jgi:hypothetical protein
LRKINLGGFVLFDHVFSPITINGCEITGTQVIVEGPNGRAVFDAGMTV